MCSRPENPYSALKRIFHEPNRLAILSVLCRSANGVTFKALKDQCNLTDGNLSRHLKALEEAHIILIEKKFVGVKPRTTIQLTNKGRDNFIDYLKALEEVLKKAAEAISEIQESPSMAFTCIKPAQA